MAPTFLVSFLFIYGLMAWNGYLSLSASRLLPNYTFVGLDQYRALFDNERWWRPLLGERDAAARRGLKAAE